jgi:hypothetical protein
MHRFAPAPWLPVAGGMALGAALFGAGYLSKIQLLGIAGLILLACFALLFRVCR